MPILVTTEVQIARFANALYGIKLGSNTNTAVEEDVTNLGLAATVNAYYNYSFGSKTSAEVANIILGNVGLAGNAAAEAFIIGQLNAAGTAKGQAVLGMLNAFANLTSDATFGAAATAWNTTIASALVYTASNTEDVAATATTIQTYVLEAGVEVVIRTAGNDIILAPHNSMDAFDVTDGGAGFDTLVIEGEDGYGGAVSAGAFTNIEKVILNSFEQFGEVLTVNANDFQGVQQIWFENSSVTDNPGAGLKASNLTDAITFGIKGESESSIGLAYKSTATTSNIVLDNLDGIAEIEISGTGVSTLNLSGSVVTTGGLPLNAAGEVGVLIDQPEDKDKITTVNVQTSETIAFDVSNIDTVTKVDASASTGNVFSIINLADVSSTDTSYGVSYLGASGNDYVEANLADLDSKDVLKGNAGDDTLLLNIGGDSYYDSGVFGPGTKEYALINKAEFEQIRFNGQYLLDDDLLVDASKLTASKIGTEENSIIKNLENTDTVIFTNTNPDTDDRTLDLSAKRDSIDSTKYATGAGTVNLVAETKGVWVDIAENISNDLPKFAKLVAIGAGNVSMDNRDGFGVEVDASGLKGSLDIELAFDAVDKVTLGSGKDEIHLYQNADDDWENALSDYGNMDTITGFATGFDKFVVANITDGDTIGYIEYKGELGVDFAQTVSLALMAAYDADKDVASFVWAGNTYLVQDVVDEDDLPNAEQGDFDPATDIVVKLTGVVSLVSTDFVAY